MHINDAFRVPRGEKFPSKALAHSPFGAGRLLWYPAGRTAARKVGKTGTFPAWYRVL